MAKYQSTKTYGTDRGLSCVFRQWKATHSHCSTFHGYSLGFKFVFESETLDEKNWCFDFGGMKPIKAYLDHMFDHTMLVAEDDPALPLIKMMSSYSVDPEFNGIDRDKVHKPTNPDTSILNEDGTWVNPTYDEGRVCDIRIVPGVGCEMTAKMVYDEASRLLELMKTGGLGRYEVNRDVRLVSVECFEHGANSAIYYGDVPEKHVFTVEIDDMSEDDVKVFLDSIKDKINDNSRKLLHQTEILLEAGCELNDLRYFVKKLNDGMKVPSSVTHSTEEAKTTPVKEHVFITPQTVRVNTRGGKTR